MGKIKLKYIFNESNTLGYEEKDQDRTLECVTSEDDEDIPNARKILNIKELYSSEKSTVFTELGRKMKTAQQKRQIRRANKKIYIPIEDEKTSDTCTSQNDTSEEDVPNTKEVPGFKKYRNFIMIWNHTTGKQRSVLGARRRVKDISIENEEISDTCTTENDISKKDKNVPNTKERSQFIYRNKNKIRQISLFLQKLLQDKEIKALQQTKPTQIRNSFEYEKKNQPSFQHHHHHPYPHHRHHQQQQQQQQQPSPPQHHHHHYHQSVQQSGFIAGVVGNPATVLAMERRDAEVREMEKARLERERLEKQQAEQQVHKHIEESLRLAQRMVSYVPQRNMQSSIGRPAFMQVQQSRTHGTLTGHPGSSHHHPSGPPGGSAVAHPVSIAQQQVQQREREEQEREARDRERKREIHHQRDHSMAAAERMHQRQAEAREKAEARERVACYATTASSAQQVRPSSVPGKVEYPPPPVHSRTSKSSLQVSARDRPIVGPTHSLPKVEPSLINYSTYQAQPPCTTYLHDLKLKNEMGPHKSLSSKSELTGGLERDHHGREVLQNPPSLLTDHKSSVIVKDIPNTKEVPNFKEYSNPEVSPALQEFEKKDISIAYEKQIVRYNTLEKDKNVSNANGISDFEEHCNSKIPIEYEETTESCTIQYDASEDDDVKNTKEKSDYKEFSNPSALQELKNKMEVLQQRKQLLSNNYNYSFLTQNFEDHVLLKELPNIKKFKNPEKFKEKELLAQLTSIEHDTDETVKYIKQSCRESTNNSEELKDVCNLLQRDIEFFTFIKEKQYKIMKTFDRAHAQVQEKLRMINNEKIALEIRGNYIQNTVKMIREENKKLDATLKVLRQTPCVE